MAQRRVTESLSLRKDSGLQGDRGERSSFLNSGSALDCPPCHARSCSCDAEVKQAMLACPTCPSPSCSCESEVQNAMLKCPTCPNAPC
eukprot:7437273-Prorocentrum_lima.AAC.1